MSREVVLSFCLLLFLLSGIGHPFLLKYYRKHEDITLLVYLLIVCVGIFGIFFLIDEIEQWLGKIHFPKISIPNPVLLQKTQSKGETRK